MMPTIRLSDTTATRLQRCAIALVDSYETVIARMLDAAEKGVPYQMPSVAALPSAPAAPIVPVNTPPQNAVKPWDVKSHEDLTHTRLIGATFDGVDIGKANWNLLAKFAHEAAFKKLGSFDALRRVTRCRVKEGRYEQDGFFYLPAIDISLQGMDANMSWDNTARLAHAVGGVAVVEFEWRNNPKACRPGEKDSLRSDA